MADEEVPTTGYSRVILYGLEIIGVSEDGTETVIYTATSKSNAIEAADHFAWINNVTFEVEPVETEEPVDTDQGELVE